MGPRVAHYQNGNLMQFIDMTEDLTFSRVALGFWRWDQWGLSTGQLGHLVDQAFDLGITTFDHADIYVDGKAEMAFGEVLAARPGLREKIQIITKSTIVYPSMTVRVKYYDTSAEHVVKQAEASLRSLRTDYIDLLLLHRPDPLIDPAETAAAFEKLHRAGKVRHFGVSNYNASQFDLLQSYTDLPLITNQIEVSVLQLDNFENGTIAHAQRQRIHPIVWSPLAGGRIFTDQDEQAMRMRTELERVRAEIDATSIDEVAFAWLYAHPVGFIPITGSCEIELVKRPVDAQKHRLTREQWFAIWSAATGRRVP